MGFIKYRRPILAAKGLETRAASTFKGNVVLSTGGRLVEHVQTLTGASTGTAVQNYGFTKITVGSTEGTAANLVYTIAAPLAGVHKVIAVDNNSTKLVTVRTLTSAATFFGSTKNSFVWSTGSTALPASVDLYGSTTSEWAVIGISSTAITIAGATA